MCLGQRRIDLEVSSRLCASRQDSESRQLIVDIAIAGCYNGSYFVFQLHIRVVAGDRIVKVTTCIISS
jgi:hypothetical protein